MKIPVILALPSQPRLVESAHAFRENRRSTIRLLSSELPRRFFTEQEQTPIAMGEPGSAESVMSAVLEPEKSATFSVRAFIDVESTQDIPEEIDGVRVFSDPRIEPFITCGTTPPIGTAGDVRAKLEVDRLADPKRQLDGHDVAIAIVDTGINIARLQAMNPAGVRFGAGNSWVSPSGIVAGKATKMHGTMMAHNALLAAPKATLLDYPIFDDPQIGGSHVGTTIGVAMEAFSHLLTNWAVRFAKGGTAEEYQGLVINNSWGIYHPDWDFPPGHRGRYCDNPDHSFYTLVKSLTDSGVDIVFAAGNCGTECPHGLCNGRTTDSIMGANAHRDVLTVAGCDLNQNRVGYSSQGPSIYGFKREKPDISAYTHFLSSELNGAGKPDDGTSTACAVASGCVAAIRARAPEATLPPRSLFAQFRSTARMPPGVTTWSPDFGYGIVDVQTVATNLGF